MRFFVAILSCLMVLAVAGPAAGATVSCAAPMVMDSASMEKGDCGTCPEKGHICDHDACCGFHIAAIPEFIHPVTPAIRTESSEAAAVKNLSSFGPDTLLDPPRA